MSSGEFHEFSDDEFAASNLFDFSNSPDTLQSLDAIGSNDQKAFLNPQDLTAAGPFPDSPNGSYHDSSSESASSSKRTGSSDSTKTPVATRESTMDDGADMKMDWGTANFTGFEDDENTFTFGREADSSAMDGLYAFGEQDDSFMNRSFDFESASSSPEAQIGGQTAMASPGMPTIKTNSPQKAGGQSSNNNKPKTANHKKQSSVSLFCFSGHVVEPLIPPHDSNLTYSSNIQPRPTASRGLLRERSPPCQPW